MRRGVCFNYVNQGVKRREGAKKQLRRYVKCGWSLIQKANIICKNHRSLLLPKITKQYLSPFPFVYVLFRVELNSNYGPREVFAAGNELETLVVFVGGQYTPHLVHSKLFDLLHRHAVSKHDKANLYRYT